MPRPTRIQFPGAWYHVFNRGARRQKIFLDRSDRERFLALVGEASSEFGLEVHAYCLMGNHYHLLVRTPEPNLASAMKQIVGSYTKAFNARHGVDGPLFRSRYQSVVVDSDRYLLTVSRYIHRNPLEADITDDLRSYEWSSFPAFAGASDKPEWLHVGETLEVAGTATRYELFVETGGPDQELESFYAKQRLGQVLGSDQFKAGLAA